jgi:hypothetical protein
METTEKKEDKAELILKLRDGTTQETDGQANARRRLFLKWNRGYSSHANLTLQRMK